MSPVLLPALVLGLLLTAAAPTPTPNTSPSPPSSAPSDLRVTAVTSRSVTLAWTAPAPGSIALAGYDVTINQAFNDLIRTEQFGDVTTATIISVVPTGQYSFRVAARNVNGQRSLSSNTVSVVTPKADTGDVTPPSAPTGLQVTGTAGGNALSWSPSTDDVGVTGYDVYQFDGLYRSTLLATVTGTAYTATPVTPRDILYVRARDAAGNLSAASTVISPPPVTTSPAPQPTCRVTYTVSSRWPGGFVADMTVANSAAAAVDGWVVDLTFQGDHRIASTWNASFSQSGSTVTLTGARWNQVVPAGGSASAGLLGSWTTGNGAPIAATLNGARCTLA
jgi:endoglucanase/cellulose 1,4-beta-cellobiosidase